MSMEAKNLGEKDQKQPSPNSQWQGKDSTIIQSNLGKNSTEHQQRSSKSQGVPDQAGQEDKDKPPTKVKSNKSISVRREKKQGTICNFIKIIYGILQENRYEQAVSWANKHSLHQNYTLLGQRDPLGTGNAPCNSFVIMDVEKFERVVLPAYFKHSNMSSFIRQLNMYGFHKLRGEKAYFEFQHQRFVEGRLDLIAEIRRKQPEFAGVSASIIPNVSKEDSKGQKKQQMKSEGFIGSAVRIQHPNMRLEKSADKQEIKDEISQVIFPSQDFLMNQSYKEISPQKTDRSPESMQELRKQRILELQEENALLKKIKKERAEKVKEHENAPKSQIEVKFSKIMFSFLAETYKKSKGEGVQRQRTQNAQKSRFRTLDGLVEHIFSEQSHLSFKEYQKCVQRICSAKSLNNFD